MKEILEQHAQQLTSEERRAVWERLARAGQRPSGTAFRYALPALAAAAAVVAIAFVTTLHRPQAPVHSGAQKLAVRAPNVAAPAPEAGSPPAMTQPLARVPARRNAHHALPAAIGERPAALAAAPVAADSASSTALLAAVPRAAAAASPPTPAAAFTGGHGVIQGRVTDQWNRPIPYASIAIPAARRGGLSDANGDFRIPNVPPGTYDLRVQMLGYKPARLDSVRVNEDLVALNDVRLTDVIVHEEKSVEVAAERRLVEVKQGATMRSVTREQLRNLPVQELSQSTTNSAGVPATGAELHVRGGRADETVFQVNGVVNRDLQPLVVPTTGGTKLPNGESYDSMFFKNYGVNPFVVTNEAPLSTFAVDVDAASYTLMKRYVELGHLPPADAVRVEEFVNHFPQDYPHFSGGEFRILVDGAPSPFRPGYELLRIGIKGREIADADRKAAQLTFVIDVSGSMSREDRLELVKRALRLLVDRLHADDRVGIVVYGTHGRVLLDPIAIGGEPLARDDDGDTAPGTPGGNRQRILNAIDQLRPEGSTNAEEGLQLGYEMARRAYRPRAINRIVLCTDGVANEGRTSPEAILARVRTEADHGVHMTTIGFGMGNYNDVLLEQLADKGDGNYYYVDDLDEARRVFVEHLTGTLQTIAKDAKVQVEFDSTRVQRWRLLGFENRDVANRDFRNDKVDAGEIGAGHEVTALYEVKRVPGATAGRLATVRLRYARPEHEAAGAPQVREIEQRFDAAALGRRFQHASARLRLDAAVAQFAEILRGSYWAKEARLADVLSVARDAARDLHDGPSTEFVTLVEKAAAIRANEPGGAGSVKP